MSTDKTTAIFAQETPEQIKLKKKAIAENAKRFQLHVNLIEVQTGSSVSAARAAAYAEGPKGLDERLHSTSA